MTRLFPRETDRAPAAVPLNPNGSRVFRVTDRTIDQRTRLILAADADAATADDAMAMANLGRETIHEVTECVELVPTAQAFHSAPEVVS